MRLITAFAIAISLFLASCSSGPAHVSTEKYFLVCANSKIPYWQEVGAGLGAAASELRVQAEVVGPDVYDPQAELKVFEEAVAKNPAGILVSPGNPQVLQPAIDAAVAKGIPVITVDSDAPASKRLYFVGTNNFQAGQLGGRTLARLLNGKGTVTFFTIDGQENLTERLNGYKAVLESYPNIKISQVVNMKGDPRVAFDTMMDLAAKNELTDAFVTLESLSGSEVAEVLDRNKVEGKVIVAMDTAANTLEWIEKGKIAATVMQKPFTMGYYGLKTIGDIVLRKPESFAGSYATDPQSPYPVFIDTGTMLIEKSNLSAVKR